MSLDRLSRLSSRRAQAEAAPALPEPEVTLTPAQVLEEINTEYERLQKELREIEMLISQSSTEVEKLAQRNAQLTNKVRNMENNIDTIPRQDIKEIYNAAQDGQMRLFNMRGQVEHLQNRQENLSRYAESLRKVLEVAGDLGAAAASASGAMPKVDTHAMYNIVKIINAQETERQSLANALHDGPAQSLTNLILQAEICERLFDSDPTRARGELTELKEAVTGNFQKVREFIFELRPMMLDDLGLTPTLKKSIEDYEQKNGIACNFTISGRDDRLPAHVEVTIFRVVQHLLKNIRMHAQATHVQVNLTVDDTAQVIVEDDGVGFDVARTMASSNKRKNIGLSTIREQVEMLGGEMNIDSSIGRGTRVEFSVPAIELDEDE